jgi:hypothetical protein
MEYKCINTIFGMALFISCCNISSAATISLDLDSNTPGIQSTRTLNPGGTYEFEVVYTGDGTTQFDTFSLDVVNTYFNNTPFIDLHSPVAGSVVDGTQTMIMDIHGANPVGNGDALTQGNMPIPSGYDDGLGGVGLASLGGIPFPLVGEDEMVSLFRGSLTTLLAGNGTLRLTGFPFGVGTELSLGGESVPVTLEDAEIAVVPLPPAVWLFVTGVMTLFGVRSCKDKERTSRLKASPRRWAFFGLAMISPLVLAASDQNADINGDLFVNNLDISKLSSCYGQDPAINSDCAMADVDEDGDIDTDDFRFVSSRLGQTYSWTPITPAPLAIADKDIRNTPHIGDFNGDGDPDFMFVLRGELALLLGNGDGSFQTPQYIMTGDSSLSVAALGDLDGNNTLDIVITNRTVNQDDYNISVLLGNGDGSFQEPQQIAAGIDTGQMDLDDFNGDKALDIVVLDDDKDSIFTLLGNGDGSFGAPQLIAVDAPVTLKLDDVNADSTPDIVVFNYSGDTDLLRFGGNFAILLGNGDGSFELSRRVPLLDYVPDLGEPGTQTSSFALGDVNGDDILDIVVDYSRYDSIGIYLGDGDNNFRRQKDLTINSRMRPTYIMLADVNGDDVLDLLFSEAWITEVGAFVVMLGYGDGQFQENYELLELYGNNIAAGYMDIALGDLNNDNMIDVVLQRGYNHNDIQLLLNQNQQRIETQ